MLCSGVFFKVCGVLMCGIGVSHVELKSVSQCLYSRTVNV